ncbi:hypothetical protein N7519_000630 [Penicillium mononematosum]|uniref:uncharacterized protein n=1 Tax=Penicillium mononematosum TaxID=268346 RepID=UPI002546C1E1|nr:uncharacterized protein N7519_000630 [Penicillium mononematosum]KAJ6190609.1 hypothetical protein N7519_000630 [Penicillium mononematosum]
MGLIAYFILPSSLRLITGAIVHRPELTYEGPRKRVRGAILSDGLRFSAREEVTVTAGTLRTPQTSCSLGLDRLMHFFARYLR